MQKIQNNLAIITGFGACVPRSLDCDELLNNLLKHEKPLAVDKLGDQDVVISKFSQDEILKVKALYPNVDVSNLDIKILFLLKAVDEALKCANIDLNTIDRSKIQMVFSTCQVSVEKIENIAKHFIFNQQSSVQPEDFLGIHYSYLSKYLSKHFNIVSSLLGFSSACAASNNALGYAKDLINLNKAEIVIVVSLDTYAISTVAGFYSLKAQVGSPTNPFGKNIGLNLGEGAGVIILESSNRVRNYPDLDSKWVLAGYGLSGDSYHITAPRPDGMGAKNCMLEALRNGGIKVEQVEYIKAHGTGTAANDAAESGAIFDIFGSNVPVSSLKSFLGHTLGSSGIIEMIIFLLLNKKGLLPPNYGFTEKRDGVTDINLLPNDFIKKDVKTAIFNSFAFGGQNSCCLLQKLGVLDIQHDLSNEKHPVYINASGIFNKLGSNNSEVFNNLSKINDNLTFYDKLDAYASIIDSVKLQDELSGYNRNSKQTKLMISSLQEIVSNNQYIKNNNKAGLIAGILYCSADVSEKYMTSVFIDKPTLASAFYFPMNTLNTVAGVSSIAYNIIGYTTNTLGSIASLVYSLSLFESNRQSDVIVSAADDITELMLSVYNHGDYVQNTKGLFSNSNKLVFSDVSASILLSKAKTKDSVEILAYESSSIFGSSSENAYDKLITNILHNAKIDIEDISAVIVTSREIDYNIKALDEALFKHFGEKKVVSSIDDKIGYGFSTSFCHSMWFGYQVLLNSFIPKINYDVLKPYLLVEEKKLNLGSKIMILSGDITGNCMALILKKCDD